MTIAPTTMTATSPRFLKAASNLIFMGYNARNDEILDNVTRMRREWEAQNGALATVRRFQRNAFRQRLCLVLAQPYLPFSGATVVFEEPSGVGCMPGGV